MILAVLPQVLFLPSGKAAGNEEKSVHKLKYCSAEEGAATRLSGGTGKYLSILQWETSLSSTNVVKCAWKFIQLVLLP